MAHVSHSLGLRGETRTAAVSTSGGQDCFGTGGRG